MKKDELIKLDTEHILDLICNTTKRCIKNDKTLTITEYENSLINLDLLKDELLIRINKIKHFKSRLYEYIYKEHIHYDSKHLDNNFSFEDENPYINSIELEKFIEKL